MDQSGEMGSPLKEFIISLAFIVAFLGLAALVIGFVDFFVLGAEPV